VRCKACDVRLGSRESTRKALGTGEFLDLCDTCFNSIRDVCPTTDNPYHSGQIDIKEVEQEDLGEEEDESQSN
jgi:hypothetical protein